MAMFDRFLHVYERRTTPTARSRWETTSGRHIIVLLPCHLHAETPIAQLCEELGHAVVAWDRGAGMTPAGWQMSIPKWEVFLVGYDLKFEPYM